MNKLTKYWLSFSALLVLRTLFDLIWVNKKGTMSTKTKIIATGIPILILAGYSIYISQGFSFLWIWPLSMVIWWAVFDGVIGKIRHGKFTFMNKNSFPDKYILIYLQNGVLTTITKILLIVFFSGFLWYWKPKDK